ncbi:winged helix-turn-helix domain-containing protein [Streptomyces uncialis]|uniref:response regulator transcription factor n=1 Tax=Streptomyces uncialis TaxID=1048205 RepID=UPI0037BC515B
MSGEGRNLRRITCVKGGPAAAQTERRGPAAPRPHILVASDCPSVETLKQDLQRHGYAAAIAASGSIALDTHHDSDLVLLDTDLPDLDGVSVCQFIRQVSDVPIIGFTSSEAEVDRVLLLEAGCDDCVDMPYRARELVARIKAVLRRTGTRNPTEPTTGGMTELLRFGPLVIDPKRREARLDGTTLTLTRKEFDLLHRLAAEPERIFQRQELMSDVWDYPADNRISVQESRTIDTHVSSLRGKLGNSEWITTIRGVGFRFGLSAAEPDQPAPGPVEPDRTPGVADLALPRLFKVRSSNGSARPGPW